jgi:endonuclease/exonuclease/phosphatase family metal-dependent hydrolase
MSHTGQVVVTKKHMELESDVIQEPQHIYPTISVLTYNIWANPDYIHERCDAIIKIIKEKQPDLVALHEVTDTTYDIFTKALDKAYLMFQVTDEHTVSGTILMCNYSTTQICENTQPYYYDFQNGRVMGVEILHIQTNLKFNFLATKLDDYVDNDHIRDQQMTIIQQVMKSMKLVILVGDFCGYDIQEDFEKRIRSMKLLDVWQHLGCPQLTKYTTSKKNPLAKVNRRWSRIYTNRTLYWQPRNLTLVGTGKIESLNIPPSKYYGVMTILRCNCGGLQVPHTPWLSSNVMEK